MMEDRTWINIWKGCTEKNLSKRFQQSRSAHKRFLIASSSRVPQEEQAAAVGSCL